MKKLFRIRYKTRYGIIEEDMTEDEIKEQKSLPVTKWFKILWEYNPETLKKIVGDLNEISTNK